MIVSFGLTTFSNDESPCLQLINSIGRGGEIRTHDPLRPRQVRYQAALRPDICCFLDFKPVSEFPIPSALPKSTQKSSDPGKTVTKPVGPQLQFHL
jgi:hypothetical protein